MMSRLRILFLVCSLVGTCSVFASQKVDRMVRLECLLRRATDKPTHANIEKIVKFFQDKSIVHGIDTFGDTLLTETVQRNDVPLVELVLQMTQGAGVRHVNKQTGLSALGYAFLHKNKKMEACLKRHGAVVMPGDKECREQCQRLERFVRGESI